MKNIYKILIIALILIIAGFGVYFIWKSLLKTPEPAVPAVVEEIKPGEIVAPALTLVSSRPVFDYWMNKADNSVYYLTSRGEIYKTMADGGEEKIISQSFPNLHELKASDDGNSIIISFGYPFEPTYTIFKISELGFQPLLEKTRSAVWKPQSSTELIYLKMNAAGLSSLNLFSLTDQKTQEIIKLNQVGFDLEWISADTVYLKQKPSFEIPASLWAIDLNLNKVHLKTKRKIGPVIRTIAKDELGLIINWSLIDDLGLKFVSNRVEGPRLSLINKENKLITNLAFITLPNKCVFDEKILYCAVPHEIPVGAKLPDDYLKRKVYFLDSLYRADLNDSNPVNWQFTEIFDGLQFPIDAINLKIKDGSLTFVNRYDQKIYSLTLPVETTEIPAETAPAAETTTTE
jgi:hypothetical protein